MPTYEYACKSCGAHTEAVQSFSDDPLTVCPTCGGSLRKVFGNIGISFKGSGFYKTDSRTSAGNGAAKSTSAASSDSSGSGSEKSGTGSETSGSSNGGDGGSSSGSGSSSTGGSSSAGGSSSGGGSNGSGNGAAKTSSTSSSGS
jgi:putative FmdB family regulatory protein